MKISWLVSLLTIALSAPLWACGSGPTQVGWGSWRILSNEMRWIGVKYNAYPLYHLTDGNPKTAWVWSGISSLKIETSKKLIFAAHAPFWVDEVRILDGYQRSEKLWKRNNRIKTLKITRDGDEGATWARTLTPIKTVSFADRRKWHSISLPRQKVLTLGLQILDVYRGTDNDLAISEVEFYDRGRKIEWQMPRAVLACDGFQDVGKVLDKKSLQKKGLLTAAPDGLIDRSSRRVIVGFDGEHDPQWSPDGRFLLGGKWDEVNGYNRLSLVEISSRRVRPLILPAMRRKLDFYAKWEKNGRLRVHFNSPKTKIPDQIVNVRALFS